MNTPDLAATLEAYCDDTVMHEFDRNNIRLAAQRLRELEAVRVEALRMATAADNDASEPLMLALFDRLCDALAMVGGGT